MEKICINLDKKEFLDMMELLQDVISGHNIADGRNRVNTVMKAQYLLNKARQSFFGINDSE